VSNIDKNSPKVEAARAICQKFAPPSPPGPPAGPTITQKDQLDYLKAAECMRAHGIDDFPDPTFVGGVHFNPPPGMNASIGNSPQFLRAQETCGKLIPSGLPHSTQGGSGQ
jgi:hypothetical protein